MHDGQASLCLETTMFGLEQRVIYKKVTYKDICSCKKHYQIL